MSSRLVACGAALRDVHGIPFGENSVAMAYMRAVTNGDLAGIEAFDGFLMKGLGLSDVKSDKQKVGWVSAMLIQKGDP